MAALIDLTGRIFNSLTVIRLDGRDKNYNTRWLCRCQCGKEIVVYGDNLRRNHSTSCGCKKGEMITLKKVKHSHAINKKNSPEYTAWSNMITRCYNPNNTHFKYYGGNGIGVCDRWRNSFSNFFLDMGNRPSEDHSIDRYPNMNGNYEPSNCRWATQIEQANNKTNNV